jgi:hypothetical protein
MSWSEAKQRSTLVNYQLRNEGDSKSVEPIMNQRSAKLIVDC